MTRVRTIGLVMVATVVCSGLSASPSVALPCWTTQEAAAGKYNEQHCVEEGGSKNYIKGELVTKIAAGLWCAKVETAGTGTFEDSGCKTKKAKGEYIPVTVKESCVQAAVSGTGTYKDSKCETAEAHGKYVLVILQVLPFLPMAGVLCLHVAEAGTGTFKSEKCEGEAEAAGGSYILIKNVPEFVPVPRLGGFTAKGSTGSLANALTSEVACSSNSATGEITGSKTVGDVLVTFSGCTSPEGGGCSVHSSGAGTGKILTRTLTGQLGRVRTGAASGVGLLLSPLAGTLFETIEGTCLAVSPAPVTGDVAAEVEPILQALPNINLVFVGSKGVQNIKEITLFSGKSNEERTEKPELLAFGAVKASETGNDALRLAEELEVT
jgi:hypothetical protein